MLVLSRKIGERIVIADNIVLTVLEVHGKRARLGITAPANVNIRRQELAPHDDIQEPAIVSSRSRD